MVVFAPLARTVDVDVACHLDRVAIACRLRPAVRGLQGVAMKQPYKCHLCNSVTFREPSSVHGRVFCSMDCVWAFAKAGKRTIHHDMICPICGKTFYAVYPNQRKYCSYTCSWEARRTKTKESIWSSLYHFYLLYTPFIPWHTYLFSKQESTYERTGC